MAEILAPDIAASLNCVREWNTSIYGDNCIPKRKDIEWLFHGPMLCFLLLLGVVGNILVIIVTTRSRLTSTGLLLVCLAISDLLNLLSYTIFYLPKRLDKYYRVHWFQDVANFVEAEERTFLTFARFCKSVSIWMVLLITGERFIAVWKPMEAQLLLTKRKTAIVMTTIILVLASIWAPKWSLYYVEKWQCSRCGGFMAVLTKHRRWPWYRIHDANVCFFLFVDYAFPLCALIVMTALMTLALERASEQRRVIASCQKQGELDETRMIIAVVIFFVVIETPNFLIYTVLKWRLFQVKLVQVINLSNNAVNFLIYALFGKTFLRKLQQLCCFHSNSSSK